jgi:hypothetical protein
MSTVFYPQTPSYIGLTLFAVAAHDVWSIPKHGSIYGDVVILSESTGGDK